MRHQRILETLRQGSRVLMPQQMSSTSPAVRQNDGYRKQSDPEEPLILRVPSGWQAARNGGQHNGEDDYYSLRSLLQDFEEIFIAMHGRRPTPAECAADANYHALYFRYAAAKKARQLQSATATFQPMATDAIMQEESRQQPAPTGGVPLEEYDAADAYGAAHACSDMSVADQRGSRPLEATADSLWQQLLGSGSALGQKRPRAELEAAAFPARLHTRPRSYVTTACQTETTAEFPHLALLQPDGPFAEGIRVD